MSGLLYVTDIPEVHATSAGVTVAFNSGGDTIKLFLTPHAGLGLHEAIRRNGWPMRCAPDAEVVPLWAGCRGCHRLSAAREEA